MYFEALYFVQFQISWKKKKIPTKKTIHILRTPLSYLLPWQSHNS